MNPTEDSGSVDPASELAALTHGLRSELARRAAGGWRGVRGSTLAGRPPRPSTPAPEGPASAARRPGPAPNAAPRPQERKERAPEPRVVDSAAAERALFGKIGASSTATRSEAQACGELASLAAKVGECTACGLCRTRTQTVFSDGTGSSRVMFIGEAPGQHEDESGVPFVGRAGALLTDIITKGMGLTRESVYIANVLKCRPPENRDPTAEEKGLCTPFLDRQIELLDPAVLIPLGRHAACHVLGVDEPMGKLRGRVHRIGGRAVIPTYHPAYLLRSPSMKKPCWQDIQLAMKELGLAPPGR